MHSNIKNFSHFMHGAGYGLGHDQLLLVTGDCELWQLLVLALP